MQNLELKILEQLEKNKDPISFKNLSLLLSVSSKTIQNKMNQMKKNSKQYGFSIQSIQGQGHILIIEDNNLYRTYTNYLNQHDKQIIDTPLKRQNYILKHLIQQNKYITINDLANELYISNSSISLDLKEIKNKIKKFDLQLKSSPSKGIMIDGLEKNKRLCLKALNDSQSLFEQETIYQIVKQIILPVSDLNQLNISDIGMQNIATHLLIASQRIKKGQFINSITSQNKIGVSKNEYTVASQIAKKAEEYFNISFSKEEIYYLLQHILGNQYLSSNDKLENSEKYQEANILYNKILKKIFNQTKIDFFDDQTLKNDIILHLIPFISRIRHNSMIKNPLNEEIQSRYVYAFELASIGLSVIEDEYKINICSDEISYFALYFVMALERAEEKDPKYKFLIVCCSGKATSQLIMFQFKQAFSKYIKSIETIEYHHLYRKNLNVIDFIITTVPIPSLSNSKNVIQINDLLQKTDIQKIEKMMKKSQYSLTNVIPKNLFFTLQDQNSKDPLSCIKDIINNISQEISLPNSFLDKVLEREKFYPTDIAKSIAIPHPITPVTDTSFVSVTILKKPILWNQKEVQIIFLLSISKEDHNELSDFFEALSSFINDSKKIHKAIQSKDYDIFIELMEQ